MAVRWPAPPRNSRALSPLPAPLPALRLPAGRCPAPTPLTLLPPGPLAPARAAAAQVCGAGANRGCCHQPDHRLHHAPQGALLPSDGEEAGRGWLAGRVAGGPRAAPRAGLAGSRWTPAAARASLVRDLRPARLLSSSTTNVAHSPPPPPRPACPRLQSAALGFVTGAITSLQSAYVFIASFILGSVMARVGAPEGRGKGGAQGPGAKRAHGVHRQGQRPLGRGAQAIAPRARSRSPSLPAHQPAPPAAQHRPLAGHAPPAHAPAGPRPRHQDDGPQGLPVHGGRALHHPPRRGLPHRHRQHQGGLVHAGQPGLLLPAAAPGKPAGGAAGACHHIPPPMHAPTSTAPACAA